MLRTSFNGFATPIKVDQITFPYAMKLHVKQVGVYFNPQEA